jgi:NAD(P)-dependent dehydrogenase (short-subunit alcohol dehydrogenase family)
VSADRGWALVVGASGGLGAAVAKGLAADGWPVELTYGRRRDAVVSLGADIEAAGGNVCGMRSLLLPDGNVGDLSGCGAVAFCAGADIGQPYLSQTSKEALRQAVDIELHGFFHVVSAALPELRQRRGRVVALVSAGLTRWPPGDGLSVVPKAGVAALVRGLAREEGRHGVRANAVAVGVAEGGLFHRLDWTDDWLDAARRNIALRRFAEVSEIADVVTFLASDRSSYVTGQVLAADGGFGI